MIKDISVNAVIGVLVICLSYLLLILILLGLAKCTPEAMTQIITISGATIGGVTGYFFISSHSKKQTS